MLYLLHCAVYCICYSATWTETKYLFLPIKLGRTKYLNKKDSKLQLEEI